jgi:prepilin signal peptidase PulO-like enzyme (type II secretory pathway)
MIAVTLGLLGLIFGSFVNAFVWRLHEQEELREKKRKPSKAQLAKYSILQGRSMCPECRHELAAKDLIPVFSWLWLRGKCRYCGKPISWQYPAVELATSVLFAVSYLAWPVPFHGIGVQEFVVWLGFLTMFMALTVYDLRWYLLPDRIVYPLMVVAAAETVILALYGHDLSVLVNAALGALIISGIFYTLFQLSAGTWIGGGDVKLAVVLGLWAGTPLKALLLMFLSSVIGTVFALPLLMRGKQALKLKVPYGPFLIAATVVVVLWGQQLVDWYTRTLLG